MIYILNISALFICRRKYTYITIKGDKWERSLHHSIMTKVEHLDDNR
jgi:hypothetical protein